MMKMRAILFGKNIVSFVLMLLTVVLLVNGLDFIRTIIFPIHTTWIAFVWGYCLQTCVFLFVVYWWFFRRFPLERATISFQSPGILRLIGYIALLFVSYFTFAYLVFSIASYLGISNIPGFGDQESLLQPLGTGAGLIAAFVIAIFIAPMIEEYVFRGWGMICLLSTMRPPFAILLNGFFFALLHFEPATIIPLFFLGSMIAWVRYKSHSLLPGIIFHMINNSLAFAADYWLR